MFGPMLERVDGGVQPYIPLGPFQLRLPFIHYRFELPDYIQGLMMCAVCLGIIPVLQEYLGMPFEIAITIVILNGFLYLWHSHLGRSRGAGLDHARHSAAPFVAEDLSRRRRAHARPHRLRIRAGRRRPGPRIGRFGAEVRRLGSRRPEGGHPLGRRRRRRAPGVRRQRQLLCQVPLDYRHLDRLRLLHPVLEPLQEHSQQQRSVQVSV